MRTNMHSSPKPKVSCSLGRVSVSVTHIKKNRAIKVKYCFISAASDARRGEGGGRTWRDTSATWAAGRPDTWQGRACDT